MTTVYKKQALLTGVGNLYLQFMETEETPSAAPKYATDVYETPSIDKVNAEISTTDKEVYLSNQLHSNPSAVTAVELTVDAGYFPEGFAEEASGMEKLGDGSWSMPTQPVKKPFRMAYPATDENDKEIVFNYAKCYLSPVSNANETKKGEFNEQIQQYKIKSFPMAYRPADGTKPSVYLKTSLQTSELEAMYDRVKLLETGWYDKTTLAAAKKALPGG